MLDKLFKIIILVFIGIFVIFTGIYVVDYKDTSQREVNVLGTGTDNFNNEVAEFTVTFTSENPDKSKAESVNNEKVKVFLESIRQFGIEEKYIKTNQLSSYQKQETAIEPPYKSRMTDWVYTQSISVKILEVSKVNDFVTLIGKSESSNVYGPNYSIDEKTIDENVLYEKAFEDAKGRAEKLATLSGKKLGKVLHITEYDSYTPQQPYLTKSMSEMGGANTQADLPAGSTEISKTLSVTFELK